ncbi:Uncharacterised protein [uncultured archaeon]|nr:Uncharacterised protein [uncultured archaeon]
MNYGESSQSINILSSLNTFFSMALRNVNRFLNYFIRTVGHSADLKATRNKMRVLGVKRAEKPLLPYFDLVARSSVRRSQVNVLAKIVASEAMKQNNLQQKMSQKDFSSLKRMTVEWIKFAVGNRMGKNEKSVPDKPTQKFLRQLGAFFPGDFATVSSYYREINELLMLVGEKLTIIYEKRGRFPE